MTIDDIEWLLRYPCDQIVMTKDTLNKIASVISSAGRIAEGIKYITSYDANQRFVKTPDSLAGKRLGILNEDDAEASMGDTIVLMVRGEIAVRVAFGGVSF